jgi:hypothetical protein
MAVRRFGRNGSQCSHQNQECYASHASAGHGEIIAFPS